MTKAGDDDHTSKLRTRTRREMRISARAAVRAAGAEGISAAPRRGGWPRHRKVDASLKEIYRIHVYQHDSACIQKVYVRHAFRNSF